MESVKWKQRLTRLMLWKALGTSLAIFLFFVAYFYLLDHPAYPVREAPLLPIDGKLPILDWSALVYFSLWIYISLPAGFMINLRAMSHYLLGATVMALVGLSFFYFFPTSVPNSPADWTHYPLLEFLKSKDHSGNACPSLHVAYAVFAASWLHEILRISGTGLLPKGINIIWCVAIVLSTLTTRQHVWIDVLSGIFLALVVSPLNLWWAHRRKVIL